MTCAELLAEFNSAAFGSPEREAAALQYNEQGCGILDPENPDHQSGGGLPPTDPPRPA